MTDGAAEAFEPGPSKRPFVFMAPETYGDPEVHLKRTWLTARYQPGPCWLCNKTCDLRLPGTCLMWAWGVPNPFHLECGDRPDLWHNSEDVKMNMLSLNAVMYQAFPLAHCFEAPPLAA